MTILHHDRKAGVKPHIESLGAVTRGDVRAQVLLPRPPRRLHGAVTLRHVRRAGLLRLGRPGPPEARRQPPGRGDACSAAGRFRSRTSPAPSRVAPRDPEPRARGGAASPSAGRIPDGVESEKPARVPLARRSTRAPALRAARDRRRRRTESGAAALGSGGRPRRPRARLERADAGGHEPPHESPRHQKKGRRARPRSASLAGARCRDQLRVWIGAICVDDEGLRVLDRHRSVTISEWSLPPGSA